MTPILSRRALNRATLARQLLLQRAAMPAFDAIEHLVGLQAQAPLAPYVTLWTRLAGFQPGELSDLLTSRQVVRSTLMRGTVHLVSAADQLTIRPLVQPMLTRKLASSEFASEIPDDELATAARAHLHTPLSRKQLGDALAETWPGHDPLSLAYAAQHVVSMVQTPPRGVWGTNSPPSWMTTEAWLGRQHDPAPDIDRIVLRYLAAFGPASVLDVQAWSGLTRLREVVERLRPQLVTFRDEHGKELFDLPDAPRPDPETPAPPRFLAEYDNVLLSHANRERVNPDGRRVPLPPGNGAAAGTLLVDGDYRADWKLTADTLRIQPFTRLSKQDKAAVEAEAAQLTDDLLQAPREVEWITVPPPRI